MKKYMPLALLIVVCTGGYFALSQRDETAVQYESVLGEEVLVTGTVSAVDRSQLAIDGPTVVTVVTADGLEKTVAVPSMGINLCRAAERIAEVGQLAVGDVVTVRGAEENGAVVPCGGALDMLTITGKVLDAVYGYQFEYYKGPDGYATFEDPATGHRDFVTGIVLYNARDYAALAVSDEPREGLPAIRLRVYQNPEHLSASVWTFRNASEVNYQLKLGDESEAVIGGANATHFVTDGLYATDVYVVAHGAHVYVLTGDYGSEESTIRQDFTDLVNSFSFIPVASQFGSEAKINPQVVCENALTYMTFASSVEAEAFVNACVNGDRPEVIEQYIQGSNLDGAAI